jgi:hypothetical protein
MEVPPKLASNGRPSSGSSLLGAGAAGSNIGAF